MAKRTTRKAAPKKPSPRKTAKPAAEYDSSNLGLGIALGVALGVAMDNIGVGIAIGIAIWASGAYRSSKKK